MSNPLLSSLGAKYKFESTPQEQAVTTANTLLAEGKITVTGVQTFDGLACAYTSAPGGGNCPDAFNPMKSKDYNFPSMAQDAYVLRDPTGAQREGPTTRRY